VRIKKYDAQPDIITRNRLDFFGAKRGQANGGKWRQKDGLLRLNISSLAEDAMALRFLEERYSRF